jgi:vacuolar-type H+-ATPase subunit I/STV1
MEQIVISALGGLLINALSGIVGNRADVAVTSAWQAIVDRLKKEGKPINHDLQRAVLRSFILALKTLCDDCINELETQKNKATEDIRWLKQKRRGLDEKLKSIEKAEYVEPSLESLKEIELLVLPDGSLAQDRISTVRSKLIETAIGDGEPPQCYKEKVEKQLFELMCIFFSDEIKGDQRVRNILEGQLLAQIDVRLQGQQLTIERIETALRDMHKVVDNLRIQANIVLVALKQMPIRLQEAGETGVKYFSFDKERDEVAKLFAMANAGERRDLMEKLLLFENKYNRYLDSIRSAIAGRATIDDINVSHRTMVEWYEKNILAAV